MIAIPDMKGRSNMTLSLILLTWNSERYIERCLNSIYSSLEALPITFEVLVLDNGSADGTGEILRRFLVTYPSNTKLFFEPSNTGTTRSRNKLLEAASGEYLCVLDSDVELPLKTMEHLLAHLRADHTVGIIAPAIFYPSGAWQKSIDHFPTLLDKLKRFFFLREIERTQSKAYIESTDPLDVDYAISAFWLFRRELLDLVGVLDERIFYAPEDVDYCLRVWKAGQRVLYVPAVRVIHHTQEISRGLKINRAKLEHLKGLAYFFMKHRYIFRRPVFAKQSVTC